VELWKNSGPRGTGRTMKEKLDGGGLARFWGGETGQGCFEGGTHLHLTGEESGGD